MSWISRTLGYLHKPIHNHYPSNDSMISFYTFTAWFQPLPYFTIFTLKYIIVLRTKWTWKSCIKTQSKHFVLDMICTFSYYGLWNAFLWHTTYKAYHIIYNKKTNKQRNKQKQKQTNKQTKIYADCQKRIAFCFTVNSNILEQLLKERHIICHLYIVWQFSLGNMGLFKWVRQST